MGILKFKVFMYYESVPLNLEKNIVEFLKIERTKVVLIITIHTKKVVLVFVHKHI